MKHHFLCIWLCTLLGLLLAACSQEEPLTPNRSKQDFFDPYDTMTPSELAQIIADADISDKAWKELNEMIQARVEEGDDEYINFSCAISDTVESKQNSKYLAKSRTPIGCCPTLRSDLIEYLSSTFNNNTRGLTPGEYDVDDILSMIAKSNLEIYWPYSDDWDGSEDLTISYWDAPSDVQHLAKEGTLLGMKYPVNQTGTNTIIDDVTYNSGKTVLVRNSTESLYSTFTHLLKPVFNDQESGESGVPYQTWNSEYDHTTYDPTLKYGENPNDYIYEWLLSKMMVSHQFDPKGAGGSEFEFTIVCPNDVGTSALCTKIQVTFTRKEIDNHTIKTFNQWFNTNWTPDQTENGLILMERDFNFSKDPLEFSISYKGITLSINIPLGDFDDEIIQQHYDRDFIITHRTDRLLLYGSENPLDNDNVYVKMPLVKKQKGTL